MNLLTKTTLYFITVSLFVFLLGGIAFYHLLRNSIRDNVDEQLRNRMHFLLSELRTKDIVPDSEALILGESIRFEPVSVSQRPFIAFSDTILYNKYSRQYESHRQFTFYLDAHGQLFKVYLYRSLKEANALIERLAAGLTALVIVFLFAILAINRFFFQRIWAEFFTTIKKINNYEVHSKEELQFPSSEIIEFQQLNLVLKKMIQQIKNDYDELKEFTENLTHEIQTPLAVIKTKIELLMQNPNLNQADIEHVHKIYSQITGLSKLNKTLILITKIENKHFADNQTVDFNERIAFHLENFEDIFETKAIICKFQPQGNCRAITDKNLADILLINLIKNAAKHNYKGGKITISSSETGFIISNTGKPCNINTKEAFKRYSFYSKSDSSLGLGLTIVKKICDLYNFKVEYYFQNEIYTVEIKFS